jgi:hypothetical protein
MTDKSVGKFAKFTDGIWREVTDGSPGVPLYAAPREWVGLTDEEIKHMLELFVIPPQHIEMVVQAIEAKLKEKNT